VYMPKVSLMFDISQAIFVIIHRPTALHEKYTTFTFAISFV